MMSLFLLLIPVILGLAALTLITAGLLSAPWYVLLLLVGLIFLVTQLLMPRQTELALQSLAPPVTPANRKGPASVPRDHTTAGDEAHLSYRGANYSPTGQPSASSAIAKPIVGKYRGCTVNLSSGAADSESLQLKPAPPTVTPLKYRGVEVVKPPESTSS